MRRPTWMPFGRIAMMALMLAGCAGAIDDPGNLLGRQRKFYDAAKEAAAAGRYMDSALNCVEALRVKADYADAKILLGSVAPRAYAERLTTAREAEAASAALALERYRELKRFTDLVAGFGVPITTVDYERKFIELEERVRSVKAGDAERAFLEAEGHFAAKRYHDAIAAYRRALGFVANYKDAGDKIAESHYRLGADLLAVKQYRSAADAFKKAIAERPGYKDAQARAGRVHAALGQYFLRNGYPRQALLEFQTADELSPGLAGVAGAIDRARAEAVRRLAVAGISNRTGQNVEGIAIEDFIADEMYSTLQKKKSQFIEMYERSRLNDVLAEHKFTLTDLVDRQTVPELGKLRGVNYIVVGKITQVSHKSSGLVRRTLQTAYEEPVYQQVTQYDKKGRARTYNQLAGYRTQHVRYEEVSWGTQIAFAGSISVFDVKTGKLVTSKNFTQRDAKGGRWAENLSQPSAMAQLSDEVKQAFKAPRGVESADVMAKRLIRTMTTRARWSRRS
jgi:tetratricopeptide (TPR) repeat protein